MLTMRYMDKNTTSALPSPCMASLGLTELRIGLYFKCDIIINMTQKFSYTRHCLFDKDYFRCLFYSNAIGIVLYDK